MIQATLLSLLLLASVSRLEASVSGCPAADIAEIGYSLNVDVDLHGQTCDDADAADIRAYISGELLVAGYTAVDGSTFAPTGGCGSRKLVDNPYVIPDKVFIDALNYPGGKCRFCRPDLDRRLAAEGDEFEDYFAPQFKAALEASLNENLPLLFACVAAEGVEVTVTIAQSDNSC